MIITSPQTSIFLTFPHILLQNILKSLDDLDRICFVLTCKKWYNSRDNYLFFETDQKFLHSSDFYLVDKQFKLNSFRKSIGKSILLNGGNIDYSAIDSSSTIPAWSNYLYFSNLFNEPIRNGWIHDGITTIHFGFSYNQYIEPGLLPTSIKTIIFGNAFNQVLAVGSIPESVEVLKFGNEFNQDILPGVLPSKLIKLEFGDDFDCELKVGSIPNSVRSLSFGNSFNNLIKPSVLPTRLKSLRFGYYFNQPLNNNILPPRLKKLHLGRRFSQPLSSKDLPRTLVKFEFVFSKDTASSRPPSCVTHLIVDNTVSVVGPGLIPEGARHLEFSHDYYHNIMNDTIPDTIETLKIGIILQQMLLPNQIPNQVHALDFGNLFNKKLEPSVLPQSLVTLKLGSTYGYELPEDVMKNSNIQSLEISSSYAHPIPSTVRNIRLMSTVYYNFKYDCFDFKSLDIGTTVKMEVAGLEQITIRIISKTHALLLSDNYFLGGFIPISSLKNGSFINFTN